jgi:hypothetical protein
VVLERDTWNTVATFRDRHGAVRNERDAERERERERDRERGIEREG